MGGRYLYRDEAAAFHRSLREQRLAEERRNNSPENLRRAAEFQSERTRQKFAENQFLDWLRTHNSSEPFPGPNPFERIS
jgi:hypothetical protein